MILPSFRSDDVIERRRYAAIQTGGSEDTTAYLATLLRFQSNLGLGDSMSNVLYRYHGTI